MIDATNSEALRWDASRACVGLRLGHASGGAAGQVEWTSRPNVSLAPRQLMLAVVAVAAVPLAVAGVFWSQGVWLVLPFAGLELAGLAAALLVHVRHVGDTERIALAAGRLTVDRQTGGALEHIELAPRRVRVEPMDGAGALVRLTAPGREVAVGRHLQRHLRPQLADELSRALRLARQAA